MSLENEALICDLVAWVAVEPKPYTDVMEAWRTSCPRLSVWEDAVDAGLIHRDPGTALVSATAKGQSFLDAQQRRAPDASL